MGSSSSSASSTTNNTRDGRVAGDNGAIGVSSEGDVAVHIVPDEAFDLGRDAIYEIADLAGLVTTEGNDTTRQLTSEAFDTTRELSAQAFDLTRDASRSAERSADTAQGALAQALRGAQMANRSEETQLSQQIIRIGIPAAALAYAVSQVWGK